MSYRTSTIALGLVVGSGIAAAAFAQSAPEPDNGDPLTRSRELPQYTASSELKLPTNWRQWIGADNRVTFRVTDGKTDIAVVYHGILPDLFREGQGVVAEGKLKPDGVFEASTILAKHDERYMPRKVVEALKKSGHWQKGAATEAAAAPLIAAAPAVAR
jgi:hypothetical protein